MGKRVGREPAHLQVPMFENAMAGFKEARRGRRVDTAQASMCPADAESASSERPERGGWALRTSWSTSCVTASDANLEIAGSREAIPS